MYVCVRAYMHARCIRGYMLDVDVYIDMYMFIYISRPSKQIKQNSQKLNYVNS